MDIDVTNRIVVARHLYELAKTTKASANDLHLFASVHLLQDAVEIFLLSLADHLNVVIPPKTEFDKYIVLVNEKIQPRKLPYASKLNRLNKQRVAAKHHVVQPNRREVERFVIVAGEFFEEVCEEFFGKSFATISAIELLQEGDVKSIMLEGQNALQNGEWEACSNFCRRAIYLAIERQYSVAEFKDGKPMNYLAAISKAPEYAKSKEYIDKNIDRPTDYIVRDHRRIDQDLATMGVDHVQYWNVCRLTSPVYLGKAGEWYVSREFAKVEEDYLKENIEYIFLATLDVMLAIDTAKKSTKFGSHDRFVTTLVKDEVPIYAKADRGSDIKFHTPTGVREIETDFETQGISDQCIYRHVWHRGEIAVMSGYIHQDDFDNS